MMNRQSRTLVIAEAGVNHNGSLETALALVEAAASAGADVVKFQTFKASRLVTKLVGRAQYQQAATSSNDSQHSMLEKLELSEDAFRQLAKACRDRGITFMSTPFDELSATFLVEELGQETLKVGSGDLTNGPLLLHLARTGRPIIVSTGMADLTDIEAALSVLAYGYVMGEAQPSNLTDCKAVYARAAGQAVLAGKVTLLQCTTEYPAAPESANLRVMNTLSLAFGLPTGFSDHTKGIHVSVAAVALGACVIEKHMTLDNNLPGPDHKASVEPGVFAEMVSAIRDVEKSLGSGLKVPHESELGNRAVVRRAVVAGQPIGRGDVLGSSNIVVKRSAVGVPAFDYWSLLGRTAQRDYDTDEPIEP
jgi:N-acetylneuraminate synthase